MWCTHYYSYNYRCVIHYAYYMCECDSFPSHSDTLWKLFSRVCWNGSRCHCLPSVITRRDPFHSVPSDTGISVLSGSSSAWPRTLMLGHAYTPNAGVLIKPSIGLECWVLTPYLLRLCRVYGCELCRYTHLGVGFNFFSRAESVEGGWHEDSGFKTPVS